MIVRLHLVKVGEDEKGMRVDLLIDQDQVEGEMLVGEIEHSGMVLGDKDQEVRIRIKGIETDQGMVGEVMMAMEAVEVVVVEEVNQEEGEVDIKEEDRLSTREMEVGLEMEMGTEMIDLLLNRIMAVSRISLDDLIPRLRPLLHLPQSRFRSNRLFSR